MTAEYKEYGWKNAREAHMNARLWPGVLRLAAATEGHSGKVRDKPEDSRQRSEVGDQMSEGGSAYAFAAASDYGVSDGSNLRGKRVLDVGCGNGFMCGQFLRLGCEVTGIDLSEQGISKARAAFAGARFEVVSADDDLLKQLAVDSFDIVISTEVVEHLYSPRAWARACFAALKPGGRFVCTTPYHGYLKNLAISLGGKWDTHASPLWDGGHIKLWSKRTLFALLHEAGFRDLEFRGVGRLPGLWMTMVVAAERPKT